MSGAAGSGRLVSTDSYVIDPLIFLAVCYRQASDLRNRSQTLRSAWRLLRYLSGYPRRRMPMGTLKAMVIDVAEAARAARRRCHQNHWRYKVVRRGGRISCLSTPLAYPTVCTGAQTASAVLLIDDTLGDHGTISNLRQAAGDWSAN